MNGDILRFVDAIHRDKSIEKSVIFQGIEAALESAARKQLDTEEEIEVNIDRETGDITAQENGQPIDPETLGRIGAQTARQVMIQKIREAESESLYEDFKERVGTIVNGSVSRFSGPNILVTIGKVEAFFPKSQQVPGESYQVGDRVRALVKEVDKKGSKVMVELSRTDPEFIRRLFELEVPEIQEGVIEIKGIASEPGNRTKVTVASNDPDVDAVGACVGVRGSRIKGIVAELNDERVDIIPWSADDKTMLENSLKPAEDIKHVKLFEDENLARVIVDEDELSVAIGKGGQNVRLASKLTGWEIDVMSREEEQELLEQEQKLSEEEEAEASEDTSESEETRETADEMVDESDEEATQEETEEEPGSDEEPSGTSNSEDEDRVEDDEEERTGEKTSEDPVDDEDQLEEADEVEAESVEDEDEDRIEEQDAENPSGDEVDERPEEEEKLSEAENLSAVNTGEETEGTSPAEPESTQT